MVDAFVPEVPESGDNLTGNFPENLPVDAPADPHFLDLSDLSLIPIIINGNHCKQLSVSNVFDHFSTFLKVVFFSLT